MMTQWAKWARKLKKEAPSFASGRASPSGGILSLRGGYSGLRNRACRRGLSQSRQSYCEELEEKLAAALEKVEGVGRTSVMITLKSDGEKAGGKGRGAHGEPGREGAGGERSSLANVQERNSTVYEKNGQGGETPYVTETLEPEISGVLVVAEGGGRIKTVQEITRRRYGIIWSGGA